MDETPILIVDDVESQLYLFEAALLKDGHRVIKAQSYSEAIEKAKEHRPGIAIVDIILPDGDGIELIADLLESAPDMKPIAITAFASIDRAIMAMRKGAVDFLVKPISPEQLTTAVRNVQIGRSINLPTRDKLENSTEIGGHIGSSIIMQDIYSVVQAVAGSQASVFITGASGTGKLRCAEAIHRHSGGSDGQFVKFDCSTIAPEAIEAELFGRCETRYHDRITGAAERAEAGTLFLDEVTALPPLLQARLLNLIQTGTATPMGALDARAVNCRLVCTSTRDPKIEVESGRFRADLFYRLNVVPIHLPPLCERGMDVVEIAEAELIRLAEREKSKPKTLSTEVKAIFLDYEWPGNIRELTNILWNIEVLKEGPIVQVEDLPQGFAQSPRASTQRRHQQRVPPQVGIFVGKTLAEIERTAVETAISAADGSIPQAAKSLNVSPSTLYRKLEGWGEPARGGRRR